MTNRRGRRQRTGPLQGHYKEGRVFRPELLAYEATRANDWVREDLPDLLWPALIASTHGSGAASTFRRLQEAVFREASHQSLEPDAFEFDGRLTSLESVPDSLRAPLVELLTKGEWIDQAMVLELCSILRHYEGVPGAWLLVEPVKDQPRAQSEDASLLIKTIVDVIRDGHLNAIVKTPPMSWLLLTAGLTIDTGTAELLRDYPLNDATRSMADSMIRASFGAQKGAREIRQPDHFQRSKEWAQSFWNQNWRMFPCFPEEESPADSPDDSAPSDVSHTLDDAEDEATALGAEEEQSEDRTPEGPIERMVSTFNRFLKESLDPSKDVDLYSPAKHEVICGLVSRAGRSAFATLRSPHMWSGEHGMAAMRVLSETRIILAWVSQQDPGVYARYQNFGRGKSKLMRIHMQDLADSFGGEPPAHLTAAIEHFQKRGGGSLGEEFQEVSLDATFSGESVRQMAAAAGLEDEYRHIYQPASGIAHGEWWAIEDYAMQRCMNPLHLFHRLASFYPEFPSTPGFDELLADRFDHLVQLALSVLYPEE